MSSKIDGSSHPILDRFLENPAEVFPPQKSFVGRLVTWVVFAGADDKMHTMETDAQIRAMASEVESYHRTSGDKVENLDLKLMAQKINSLDVEESQKEAIHKLITKTFMKSMYEGHYEREINSVTEACAAQDIDDFIKKNDKTTCDIFMQVLLFLDEENKDSDFWAYGKSKEDLIKYSMALLQGGTCNALFMPDLPENDRQTSRNLLMLINLLGTNEKALREFVKPILQRITLNDGLWHSQHLLASIIDKLALLSTRERQQLLKDIASLIKISSINQLNNVISALSDMSSVDRRQALRDTAPLEKFVLSDALAYVAKAISSVQPSSRPEIIKALLSTNIPISLWSTLEATSDTIRVIGEIGLEKFMEALRDVAPIKNLGKDLNTNTIKSIANLPKEVRKKMAEALSPTGSLKEFLTTPEALKKAINGIVKIGLDNFIEAFHDLTPLFNIQEGDPIPSHVKAGIVMMAAEIPREHRQKLIDALSFANTTPFEKHVSLAGISATVSLIPPEYIEKHLERWVAESGNVAPILHLLVEDEQSREALHNHLMQALDKAMVSSPKSASELADKIISRYESLGLHDEHPLYQQAINVKLLTDPDSVKGPKDPYTIYNSLLKGEPLVDFPVPSVKIEEGLFCSFDVQGLQSARKKLTFADLPKIDKQFLKKSFEALETRMEAELALAKDPKKIKELSEQIEAIENVKANVLNAVLIPSLLNIKEGKPHEPIPQSLFQLYTVIAYLTSLSNDRKTGQPLSEQEDELTLFAQCIEHCKTGQEDGLAEYYNGVLAKGFSNQPADEGSSLEAVKRFAQSPIQATFGRALAGEKTFRKVMGFSSKQKIPQLVHQLGYWKNKIYAQIGFQHTVTFDENSGWIMDELINKSASELAEETLKEISFSTVVDDFLGKVNRALRASGKPAIGMAQIYDVLEKQLAPPNSNWSDPGDDNKGPGARYFTFDEYGTPNGITRLAVAHLLIAAHYGKQTA